MVKTSQAGIKIGGVKWFAHALPGGLMLTTLDIRLNGRGFKSSHAAAR